MHRTSTPPHLLTRSTSRPLSRTNSDAPTPKAGPASSTQSSVQLRRRPSPQPDRQSSADSMLASSSGDSDAAAADPQHNSGDDEDVLAFVRSLVPNGRNGGPVSSPPPRRVQKDRPNARRSQGISLPPCELPPPPVAVPQAWGTDSSSRMVALPLPLPDAARYDPFSAVGSSSLSLDIPAMVHHFLLQGKLTEAAAMRLATEANTLFRREPNVLRLPQRRGCHQASATAATSNVGEGDADKGSAQTPPPVVVIGDIHGQFHDLVKLLHMQRTEQELAGKGTKRTLLFLGDLVDRGAFGCEVVLLVFALKVLEPDSVFVLRGNHEARHVTHQFTFHAECTGKYSQRVYNAIMDTFDALPLAATVGGRYFCVHGGLSPSVTQIEDINLIHRFREVPTTGPMCDLLWADPTDDYDDETACESIHRGGAPAFEPNEARGCGVTFNFAAVEAFLAANPGIITVIRAHEMQPRGFRLHRPATLFATSSTNGAEKVQPGSRTASPRSSNSFSRTTSAVSMPTIPSSGTTTFTRSGGSRHASKAPPAASPGAPLTFPSVIGIFSAPNYCGSCDNGGAFLTLDGLQWADEGQPLLPRQRPQLHIHQFFSTARPFHLAGNLNAVQWSFPFLVDRLMDALAVMLYADIPEAAPPVAPFARDVSPPSNAASPPSRGVGDGLTYQPTSNSEATALKDPPVLRRRRTGGEGQPSQEVW